MELSVESIALVVGLIILVGLGLAIWMRRRSPEEKRDLPQVLKAPPESIQIPKKVAPPEPVLVAPTKRPLSFKKALTHWLPLLESQTKDRDRWEEALIMSDMGPRLAQELLDGLQQAPADPKSFFVGRLKEILKPAESVTEPWTAHQPWICFVVGVNGVGKTSTIVKMAAYFQSLGKSVGVVGADTFRKAAIEQLERGCAKVGAAFFSVKTSDEESEGADPSSVIFDGLKTFKTLDIVLVDTSGRLHTKKNLMEELKKMKRVADKSIAGAPHDVWLVLDTTLGQNALQQAQVFHEAVQLTGLILTKLDGLSKGGAIFQLYRSLQTPIRFLAHGEDVNDISPFRSEIFVEELFDLKAS